MSVEGPGSPQGHTPTIFQRPYHTYFVYSRGIPLRVPWPLPGVLLSYCSLIFLPPLPHILTHALPTEGKMFGFIPPINYACAIGAMLTGPCCETFPTILA